jgi:predicted aldo/keto reductase-like oxidoreductase
MQYRKFGRLDWQVSALGFGCARFPTVNGKEFDPEISEAEAIIMLRYAIDHGVNYVDTAHIYHGGNSEIVVGRALQDGYRAKVKLADKSPIWLLEHGEDFDTILDGQLRKLQTNHVDFYLLHGLDAKSWLKVQELDLFARAEKAIADGRIGHLGFSFHDTVDVFQQIVDGYDKWTFCQFIYNFLDTERQAGTRGLRYAAAKGLAIVVMEPIQGGKIARPPDPVRAIWEGTPPTRTVSALALQWVWDHPEVAVALSGMSMMQQVEENVACADASRDNPLNEDELALIGRVQEVYRQLEPEPAA